MWNVMERKVDNHLSKLQRNGPAHSSPSCLSECRLVLDDDLNIIFLSNGYVDETTSQGPTLLKSQKLLP
ncbi:hypothetical protein STEG23_023714 [Scotinomys teguina]